MPADPVVYFITVLNLCLIPVLLLHFIRIIHILQVIYSRLRFLLNRLIILDWLLLAWFWMEFQVSHMSKQGICVIQVLLWWWLVHIISPLLWRFAKYIKGSSAIFIMNIGIIWVMLWLRPTWSIIVLMIIPWWTILIVFFILPVLAPHREWEYFIHGSLLFLLL